MSKDVEILIVEENLAESEHLKHILEQHEYRVSVEHTGKIALDAARANPPHIVISAIEKAQTASPLNEELLSVMLESTKDYSIFTTDAEGRVTSWNAGAERFFGYSEAEILGQNVAILFTPEDRDNGAPEQELHTAVTKGRAEDERWHLHKDGTRFWVNGMVRPHWDHAGQLRGFIKIARDLTERKIAQDELRKAHNELEQRVEKRTAQLKKANEKLQAQINKRKLVEEKLRENEEWLRAIFDASRDGLLVENDGKIVFINNSYAAMLGYDKTEELLGKDVSVLLSLDDLERMTAYGKARQRGETPPTYYEFKVKRKDGSLVDSEANIATAVVGGKIHAITAVRDITERKQAEVSLRQSEANLAAAQRIAHLGSWELDIIDLEDSSKNTVQCSDEVYRIFGYEPGQIEVTAEIFYGFVHSHEQTRIREAVFEAIKKRNALNIEIPIVFLDKKERIIYVQAEVIYDEQSNKPLKLIGIIQDITECKQAEQTVRESEARYRVVTESVSDTIITIDVENTILFINPAAEKMFGYALDEMLGNNLSMLMPEKFRGAHTAGIKRYAATGKRNISWQGVEVSALHKDGHEVPVEITFGELYLDGKHLFTAVIRDITNRKLVREALEKSERQYRFLSEGIMHQVWTARPDGILDYVNGRTLEYFGMTYEQGIKDGWQSVVHPDDVAGCSKRWTKSLETGEYYQVEFRLKKSDGTYRWHLGRATAGRDSEGKIIKWFGTNTDINDLKLVEESLRKSEERLQQSQKMEAIGTLTGGVAHDFNNLLTAILGNTQLAQRKLPPNDSIQLRLMEVVNAGNRAAKLTHKLLAFSRRQHLERRTVNLNHTIGEVVKLLERIIGEDVEMSVKYASDLSAVFADPVQLEQVIMNLAANARDAMPWGGKLTIETSNVELDESLCLLYPSMIPGRYIQIKVSDSGTGIDEETQARIFEPYFTTKEVGKGTGLGLSMAYGIIKQHDGYINIYSELGLGTTFKIYLPIDKKTVEENVQTILSSFLGGTETILIAEDEEMLRNLTKETLEDLGYTVLLAKNGEEAVEVFGANRERIDLFLSDVVMPRMGGSEAYEQIRKMGGNVPLIFMTGYNLETVQSRFLKPKTKAEELGAVIIQKPYSLEELGRIVREVLNKNHKP